MNDKELGEFLGYLYGGIYQTMTDAEFREGRGEFPSITCPYCEMTSFNPNDIKYGFCGMCHDFTTPRLFSSYFIQTGLEGG